ncbi:hypothetical protein [Jiella avicenniae]|uniref:Uncharacterized protein n=1 Tax=Jiella avicenniae TaxID=2907202 RepID=A0A9X1P601_9HYPH|nr:hypothetical protein [Jiella avicenniae]MCE7030920.1 hypothetical protein [Jiella avicenniae]
MAFCFGVVLHSSLIVYHGTSADRLSSIIENGFQPGRRDASWLGHGIYFFFQAPERARLWGIDSARRRGVSNAVLLKCTIDLSDNINLLEPDYWPLLKNAYNHVPTHLHQIGIEGLFETDPGTPERIGWNYRDCAAVNALTETIERLGIAVGSIMAAFIEGLPASESSWLFDQSSLMICVKRPGVLTVLDHEIIGQI